MIFVRCALLLGLLVIGARNGGSLIAVTLLMYNASVSLIIFSNTTFFGRRQIFGAGLAVVGGLFVSLRASLGEFNLEFLPQGYRIDASSLGALESQAQLSVAVTLTTYIALRTVWPDYRPATNISSLRQTLPFGTVRKAAIGLVTIRLLLQFGGVGVKSAVGTIPLGANIFTVVEVLAPLAIVALLVEAFTSGDKKKLRFATALLALEAIVIAFGGARGGVVLAGTLFSFAFLGTGGRVNKRTFFKALGAIAIGIVGLQFSIGRRESIAGGTDFGLVEFLLLRLPGFHRLAPVLDRRVELGWIGAVQPDAVKLNVYGLPDERVVNLGTSWPGLGFLASGLSGLLLISIVCGLLAFLGDRWLRRSKSTASLTVWIFLASFAVQAYSAARPRTEIRELLILGLVAVAWKTNLALSRRRNGSSKSERRATNVQSQTQAVA